MPGDFTPSKIVHDEKRLDRVLKENRALVMRCKELEIKLESRYIFVKTCYVDECCRNMKLTWTKLVSKCKIGESLNPGIVTVRGCRRR